MAIGNMYRTFSEIWTCAG